MNLESKKIQIDKICAKCFEADETSYHALRGCEVTIEVWQLLNSEWHIDQTEYGKIRNWFQNNMINLNLKQLQQVAITTWAV